MKKILLLTAFLPAVQAGAAETIGLQSEGNEPTVIFGEAATAAGTFNEITVTQAADAPNPFGDPVAEPQPPAPKKKAALKKKKPAAGENVQNPAPPLNQAMDVVSETSAQNPEISPENSPEQMQNEIQNTLYESDNRIYDLQSYPDDDINQIENEGNAVTNYPEY